MDSSKLAPISAVAAALFGRDGESAQGVDAELGRARGGHYVELLRERFQGELDGRQCDLYTIENARGSFVKLSNFGAKIVQVVVPDAAGGLGDVVLGYDSLEAMQSGLSAMGAFVGRYANRIAGGRLSLDGRQYQLTLSDGGGRPNMLHGGERGSPLRVFDAVQLSRRSVLMSYTFADGEEGFPGTLAVTVVYSLLDDGALHIEYAGTALDKRTVCNLTSHPFFNLSNHPGSQILEHVLTIHADRVLDIDDQLIPTGRLCDVDGTPMDFRRGKPIGRELSADHELLARGGGYDHTWVLNKSAPGRLSLAASVYEPTSGRTLTVRSTEPGLQFYGGAIFTGQPPRDVGKGGVPYPRYAGFALEPMHYPDSQNQPSFPSTVLEPGETYRGAIVYHFGARDRAGPT